MWGCCGVLPYVPSIRAGGVGFGDLSRSKLSLLGRGRGSYALKKFKVLNCRYFGYVDPLLDCLEMLAL